MSRLERPVKAGPVLANGGVVPGPVLVSDGETRTALAATRALAARGETVHVLARRRGSLASASRHAAREHVMPDPEAAPDAWLAALRALCAEQPGALVLPVTDVAVANVLAADPPLDAVVAAPPRAAFDAVTDKHGLLERARRVGLAAPRSIFLPNPRALEALPEGFHYPVVLKSRRSRWREGPRWCSGVAHRVEGPGELPRVRALPDFEAGALLQEYVPGRGEGIFLLVEEGRVAARFAHRRVREKPPWGGVSVVCEAIEPDPALLGGCERLLAELGWHGVAMVEFRRAPDGSAALMEINPRLWGSLQLAIEAGADFAWLAVALHRGDPLPRLAPHAGVRTRWLLGDLDHLLVAARRAEQRQATGRGALRVVGDFLAGFVDGSRPEVWRPDDRGPFWRELRSWRP